MKELYDWVQRDYSDHPRRFVMEILAWFGCVTSALIMASTIPNPPFLLIYPIWLAASSTFCWAAITRGSFGMAANYSIMICIDLFALVNLLT